MIKIIECDDFLHWADLNYRFTIYHIKNIAFCKQWSEPKKYNDKFAIIYIDEFINEITESEFNKIVTINDITELV